MNSCDPQDAQPIPTAKKLRNNGSRRKYGARNGNTGCLLGSRFQDWRKKWEKITFHARWDPISQVITPVTHFDKAIYEGPITPFLSSNTECSLPDFCQKDPVMFKKWRWPMYTPIPKYHLWWFASLQLWAGFGSACFHDIFTNLNCKVLGGWISNLSMHKKLVLLMEEILHCSSW